MTALGRGLARLELDIDRVGVERLERFMTLLNRWNRVHNLTRISAGDAVVLHLLDSLSVAPHLAGRTVIDVGSGGGLPGVPLAIASPGRHFTLLDKSGKKARFLEQARIELGLDNVTVIHGRVESLAGTFDTVVCRALASLAQIAALTAHLLTPDSRVLAMKAAVTAPELIDDLAPLGVERVESLDVPGMDAVRQLVVMKRIDA